MYNEFEDDKMIRKYDKKEVNAKTNIKAYQCDIFMNYDAFVEIDSSKNKMSI